MTNTTVPEHFEHLRIGRPRPGLHIECRIALLGELIDHTATDTDAVDADLDGLSLARLRDDAPGCLGRGLLAARLDDTDVPAPGRRDDSLV